MEFREVTFLVEDCSCLLAFSFREGSEGGEVPILQEAWFRAGVQVRPQNGCMGGIAKKQEI